MPTPRTRVLGPTVAITLLVVGLVFAALFRILSGVEHHAYSSGAVPPADAHVTDGRTYQLSVPGGVKALLDRGLDVNTAQCEWSTGGSASQVLTAEAAGRSTKATNVVATFTAPFTGKIHVDCTGWGAMYIDDADDTPGDPSGWFLVIAVIALTLGVTLGLSALRAVGGPDATSAAGDDDEIERLVHAVHVRSQDGEIGRDDGDDVLT